MLQFHAGVEQVPPECRAGGVEQLYRVCPQCSGNVTSRAALGALLCLIVGNWNCWAVSAAAPELPGLGARPVL